VRLQNYFFFHPSDRSLAWADAGVDPIDFPEAPTRALPIALQKANLTIKDIAQFEFNEAFSVVVRIAVKICDIDESKINVNGCVHLVLHQFYLSSLFLGVLSPSVTPSAIPVHVSSSRWFTHSRAESTVPQEFVTGYVSFKLSF
jgi:hypothetical protein